MISFKIIQISPHTQSGNSVIDVEFSPLYIVKWVIFCDVILGKITIYASIIKILECQRWWEEWNCYYRKDNFVLWKKHFFMSWKYIFILIRKLFKTAMETIEYQIELK